MSDEPHVYVGKDPNFPWGDLDPKGGFKVGDYVGIIHSDNDTYMFDEPKGLVIAVSESSVTVSIPIDAPMGKVYLIARPKRGQSIDRYGQVNRESTP